MIEYPVFDMMPDFSAEPVIRVLSLADVVAISPAAQMILAWPEEREEVVITYQLAFGTMAEAVRFKRHMQDFGGCHGAFFMPSWSRDFELASLPVKDARQINVTDNDFDALLSTTYPDRPARHIYVACPVNGVHAMRVLRATSGLLDIEPPLPWDVTEGAICGILGLVRLDSDEITIEHVTPSQITTSLPFRTVLATMALDRDVELDNTAEYNGFGPFTLASQVLENAPTLRYDFELTHGPDSYLTPGTGPYVVNWSAWLGTDGIYFARAFILDGESIWGVTDGDGTKSNLYDFRPNTDHVSLAFDGDGREVLAIELPGGNTCIRGMMDGSLFEIVFPGKSPRLVQRNTVTGEDLEQKIEVACFYLKPGDAGIYARFEFDAFGEEICLGGWPSPPLVLLGSEGADYTLTLRAIDNTHRRMSITAEYPVPEPTPTPTPVSSPMPTPPYPTPPVSGATPTPPMPTATPETPMPSPTGTGMPPPTPTPTPP